MACTVPSIDWKLQENARAHHTNRYPGTELVVRRGEVFNISVDFHGPPPPAVNMKFTVATGSTSALQEKTRVEFGISSTPPTGSWGAVQTSVAATSMGFSISSPENAIIGRYWLGIKTSSSASSSNLGTFVLLFNPWLPEDDVFMPDNTEREEYVLSDFGVIFFGTVNQIFDLAWNYGQFQAGILNICLSILDQSISCLRDPITDVFRRDDPKYIARVVSATVNYDEDDERGVLVGNWSGDYTGGVDPRSWTGSVDILQQWENSGFQPVKYGQCWVFAGVMTTVLRCLGIPTRTITNFESGHDGDNDLIVDRYIDSKGNPLEDMSPDSTWNFHVWNESWFVRNELGSMYNGWQISDGTPQEISEGIYQCGPASLTAIKEGDVDLNYDGPFIFAEVDADIVNWLYDISTKQKTKISTDITSIGQFISTKAVGSYDRQDVTDSYKYPAGSAKEREVYEKARQKLHPAMLEARELKDENPSVSGEFEVDGPLEVGKDVLLALKLSNLVSAAESMTVNMVAWTIVYTGKPIYEVWKDSLPVNLDPKEEKAFPIKISYAEYQKHLTSDNMIQITALCEINDGSYALVEKVIILANPDVTMKVLGQAKVGKEVRVEVMFTNPLEEQLEDCVLQAEGSDLVVDTLKLQVSPLMAKETSRFHLDITPSRSGTKHLIINFSCNKFKHIKAFETITVED